MDSLYEGRAEIEHRTFSIVGTFTPAPFLSLSAAPGGAAIDTLSCAAMFDRGDLPSHISYEHSGTGCWVPPGCTTPSAPLPV